MADTIKSRAETWLSQFPLSGADRADDAADPQHAGTPAAPCEHPEDGRCSSALVPGDPDYAVLFEHAPVGYMLLDCRGHIERINRTGATMLGWTQHWLTGKPFSRWVATADRQVLREHWHQLRRSGYGVSVSQELEIKNRYGRPIALRLQSAVQPPQFPDVPASIYCAMIDVSTDRQSTRQLRQLQAQLAHVTRLQTAGELASGLAHEINQPLGTVVLSCESVLRALRSGEFDNLDLEESLLQATEAASYASGIIRDMRSFLRKDQDLYHECRLRDVIREIVSLIGADARDNDVDLEIKLQDGMPAVRMDPVQIEQVLVNLAHNSIEALGETNASLPRVLIRAGFEDGAIRVSVIDNGPGLSAEKLARVFHPFYTTKKGGMGMGLPISRRIIEAHGGKLWADCDPGRGSAMHFTLPVAERDGN